MPLCILASWESIQTRVKEYMIAFLVLETLMIGVFCALDIVLFYIFFEAGLIPMFLIIGVWGGKRAGSTPRSSSSSTRCSARS
jgi:NADH-quinone oxidoreductase subunit M